MNHSAFGELHPVSNGLGVVYTIVQEAIIGYSAILPIALRAQDSWVMADEGTTAHISRRHMQKYLGIVAHPPVAERGDMIVTSLRVSEVFNLSSAGSKRILTVNQVFDRLGRRDTGPFQ